MTAGNNEMRFKRDTVISRKPNTVKGTADCVLQPAVLYYAENATRSPKYKYYSAYFNTSLEEIEKLIYNSITDLHALQERNGKSDYSNTTKMKRGNAAYEYTHERRVE